MKRKYSSPVSRLIAVQPAQMIAASVGDVHEEVGDIEQYSNKKGAWDSSLWSEDE